MSKPVAGALSRALFIAQLRSTTCAQFHLFGRRRVLLTPR
jgi:hypothetical protein